ncbi:MAG: insulinase family protein, partial [Bacteroidales bacterium]|nr:insulinase family protein [Bacteroidales bacterium]
MRLKQAWKLLLGALLLGCWGGLQAQTEGNYQFTTVENDPLHVQMYTLDNGMQVFLSVNKSEPRIQAYIPVRVGSKHDPLETTGLAHYFEHMMFKGTSHFGTVDFEQENVLLQAIADQFEVYRSLTDSAERAKVYRVIDSLSYEASKLAIPNEYDKLMTSIGSSATNAGTSYDFTIYIENVPSNQLENWAKVQSERLENMVLRLFHTEIETVYEEKNMSLTDDNRRVSELILSTLFPHHPYGIHNVLGLGEHLKNPSLKNIQAFYDTYYVPNNMAIVLSGDFDPQEAMAIIDKYFGKLQPKEVPEFSYEKEAPLEAPVEKEVVGLEAERVVVGFPMGGSPTKEAILGDLVGNMLYNGQAGLYDLDLNQAQKVMYAYAYPSTLVDYGVFMLGGMPKAGQTLEEVKDLMLEGLTRIKAGDFPDWMLEATIDNKKFELYK